MNAYMITGGTGTLGQQLVRQLISDGVDPSDIFIFSRCEFKQYTMAHEWPNLNYRIGDVRDAARVNEIMTEASSKRGSSRLIVIHASALKHVPVCEQNPVEAIKTNVLGAINVIDAAKKNGVGKVIALSTDKASAPINLYGATKLCSDKLFTASSTVVTRMSVVRYGNVVSSRGSFVPYFRELSKNGKSIPITDERMTRFFITIEDAVKFVLDSSNIMKGGEIFVPKIQAALIMDAARYALNNPSGADWYHVIGPRQGEKIHETMISSEDSNMAMDIGDRYVVTRTEEDLLAWSAHGHRVRDTHPQGFEFSSETAQRMTDFRIFDK